MAIAKSVKRISFHGTNILYHLLCLSGLVWQITQISTNFLLYDVLKDINVIMPEKVNRSEMILTVCFENYEILIYDKYITGFGNKELGLTFSPNPDLALMKYLVFRDSTFSERFNMTPNSSALYRGNSKGIDFMSGRLYCTQRNYYTIRKLWMSNVSALYVVSGHRFPIFNLNRLIRIEKFGNENQSAAVKIDSYSYSLERLPHPYIDNCMDYKKLGYRNRQEAMANCEENLHPGKVSMYRNIDRSSKDILNKKYSPQHDKICSDAKDDCVQKIYLTKIVSSVYSPHRLPTVALSISRTQLPSFTVVSKPRIDNINYVTYILGALGTWLGFSFASINPIRCIQKYVMTQPDSHDHFCTSSVRLRNRTSSLEREVHMLKQEIVHINQIIIERRVIVTSNDPE